MSNKLDEIRQRIKEREASRTEADVEKEEKLGPAPIPLPKRVTENTCHFCLVQEGKRVAEGKGHRIEVRRHTGGLSHFTKDVVEIDATGREEIVASFGHIPDTCTYPPEAA